jgi:hypothetical protein
MALSFDYQRATLTFPVDKFPADETDITALAKWIQDIADAFPARFKTSQELRTLCHAAWQAWVQHDPSVSHLVGVPTYPPGAPCLLFPLAPGCELSGLRPLATGPLSSSAAFCSC